MKKIKAIIFDLNGIFLTSAPLSERVEKEFGINKDLFLEKFKEILKTARTVHQRNSDLWQPIADILKISVDDFLKFWFSGETINYEILEFAKKLKIEGYKIYILSNNLKERTEYYRQNLPELFNTFDDVYFSCVTEFVKPDPKAFQNILTKNNLNPSECLFFDDSPQNVQVALNLGIKSRVYDGLEATKKFIAENQ